MTKNILFLFLFTSFLYGELIPIVFKGNKSLSDRELYSAINLEQPYLYEFWKEEPKVSLKTTNLLTQIIKNYYRSKGYFHTSVSHSESNNSIEIFIDEKSSMKVADIAIISTLEIDSVIPFKVGEIFDAIKFDTSKKEIKLFYANEGYCDTQINAKTWIDLETDKAYLVYDITQNELCYFGEITIIPPESIDSEIIRSLLYIQKNEPFSPNLISRSYKSLYGQEGISKAIIDTKVQSKTNAPVEITVTENEKPIRFQAGAGLSSDEGFTLSLGVKHNNLFGNLKTLSVNTHLTQIKESIKSNFEMPLSNRNFTGIEVGYENEKFPGYKESRVGGMVFLRQREILHTFQESLLFDHSNTYDSDDLELFPEGKLFVLSPKFEWSYDTRDNLLDPKKGYLLSLELMGSVLSEISDASYYKYQVSGAYIIPMLPSIIALKANIGSLHLYDGEVPASYRFYSGGMNSNRAYSYRQLGPVNDDGDPTGLSSIVETTAEYRFPIYGNFRGVVFSDNTFIGNSSYAENRGYYSAGVGLRYVTPIGPLAIDLGFDIKDPLKQYAIHFHIGELF